jgi:G:T/U-mismatch repair DNA glycosylase
LKTYTYNQGTFGGGSYDAFILKFNTSGVRQWATYYGGTGSEYAYSIHSDGTSMWVSGTTSSTDFPIQNLSGAYNQGTHGGGYNDAFILKFNTSGVRAWATYYGGTGSDPSHSIHSDGTSVWVTGQTESTDFPLQTLSGAYNQGTYGGGTYDAFILKFSTSGVRAWATYYGGNNYDEGRSIYSEGTNLWITGTTGSTDFPIQNLSGAYNQGNYGGGDYDAFILKFSTSGVRAWATYYGGTGAEFAYSIHSAGTSVWVTGTTSSTDFPIKTLSGAYNQGTYGGSGDAFILKFDISGVRHWATYYGGTGGDAGESVYCKETNIWISGITSSTDLPLQNLSGAYNQGWFGGGNTDAFIINFDTSGVRHWATYYGGFGDEFSNEINSDGISVWVTGRTASFNFPLQTLPGAYNQSTYEGGYDAFILKFTAQTIGIKLISEDVPMSYSLCQNYPNPFNPATSIRYDIPRSGMVTLIVFDALGRQLETLVNESQMAGTYEATFDATKYPSGVYFYKLITKDFVQTRRMMLVK